jgi:hypothetical protein
MLKEADKHKYHLEYQLEVLEALKNAPLLGESKKVQYRGMCAPRTSPITPLFLKRD